MCCFAWVHAVTGKSKARKSRADLCADQSALSKTRHEQGATAACTMKNEVARSFERRTKAPSEIRQCLCFLQHDCASKWDAAISGRAFCAAWGHRQIIVIFCQAIIGLKL